MIIVGKKAMRLCPRCGWIDVVDVVEPNSHPSFKCRKCGFLSSPNMWRDLVYMGEGISGPGAVEYMKQVIKRSH
jgi:Zn ribbon nucleic-acid-binding protein